MKYAMHPAVWEESAAALDAAGHTHVALSENPDLLFFAGKTEDFPEDLPESVQLIQVPFAGVDGILDLIADTHSKYGVRWSNAAGVYDSTVAESTIGLLLAQLHAHKRVTLAKSWDVRDEAEANTTFLFEDSTVAIIGAGGIGKKLISMLSGFGPKIIAVNRSGKPVEGADEVYTFDQIDEVWPAADYFLMLAPLTPETHHMVNADALAKMPKHAVVVNVGRGPLVDTDALTEALKDGTIAGAGLDVTDPEPLPDGHPLWDEVNCIITPHLANPPYSVRNRIGAHTVEVLKALEAGEEIPTEVDPKLGY
ncbi:D-isomer specific 2-hydroxyacid dehydrogenase family protein [Corynebacterium sp. L4756]|uniref:D-isomer specific 2-hydroxyacid dehydrogenase family protein n=1 Tax=unclassified Corynebacterium TaxID=2624378 RepID=UPI00374CB3F4